MSESYKQYSIAHNPQQEVFCKVVFVDCAFNVSFLKLFLVESSYLSFFINVLLVWVFHPTKRIFYSE